MSHTVFRPAALLLAVVVGLSVAVPSHAQNVGVGGQIGEPSGVTLKLHNPGGPSYDFLAAWSLESDVLFLNAHVLFENRIAAANIGRPLEWFVGPGGFIALTDDATIGASGTIGLNLILTDQISIYARLTPRFALIPATEGDLGGGLGIRFFF